MQKFVLINISYVYYHTVLIVKPVPCIMCIQITQLVYTHKMLFKPQKVLNRQKNMYLQTIVHIFYVL